MLCCFVMWQSVAYVVWCGVRDISPNKTDQTKPPKRNYPNETTQVKGVREFLCGGSLVCESYSVRTALRHGETPELVLVKRPPPHAADEEESVSERELVYEELAPPSIIPMTESDYQHQHSSRPLRDREWQDVETLPHREVSLPWRVRVRAVSHCGPEELPRLDESVASLFVRSFLFHGGEVLRGSVRSTPLVARSANPRWSEWLRHRSEDLLSDLPINTIPREARVAFLLCGSSSPELPAPRPEGERDRDRERDKARLLAWVVVQLFDQYGKMASGRQAVRLWPHEGGGVREAERKKEKEIAAASAAGGSPLDEETSFLFRCTNRDNACQHAGRPSTTLYLEFNTFAVPVVAPFFDVDAQPPDPKMLLPIAENKYLECLRRIEFLVNTDPLFILSDEDKHLLWGCRHALVSIPLALPKVCMCIDWTKPVLVRELHRLLALWVPPTAPVSALELLGYKFADFRLRAYAVQLLDQLDDDTLALYLLQLVQCIKFEPYHDSPLVRFLLRRALANPYQVGHPFFW